MIFNFSKNNQFSTEIKMENDVIETVTETKLLGTTITSDLSWNKNTEKRGTFMSGFKSHNKQLTGNFLSPIWLKSLVVKLAPNSTHHTKFESNRS